MVETKLTGPSMEERIAKRLLNSGEGAKPATCVQTGTSPQRVFHNIHATPNKQTGSGEGSKR
jgi:hypothetical protein